MSSTSLQLEKREDALSTELGISTTPEVVRTEPPSPSQVESDSAVALKELEDLIGMKASATDGLQLSKTQALQKLQALDQGTEDFPATRKFAQQPENTPKVQENIPNLTNKELLVRSFKKGQLLHQMGEAGTELRTTRDPLIQAEIDNIEAQIAALGEDPEGFISFFTSAAEVIGQMLGGIIKPEFAAGVGLGAGVGTAVLPGIGTVAGGAKGGLAAITLDAFEVEGGLAYIDLRKEGVPEEEAKFLSLGVGVINAALELTSATVLLAPVARFGKALFKREVKEILADRGLRALITTFGKAYGAGVLTETATEVVQEMVNIAAEEIGKQFTGKESITEEEFISRIGQIAEKTFKAMVVMAPVAPGGSLVLEAKQIREAKKNKQILDSIKVNVDESNTDPVTDAEHTKAVLEELGNEKIYIPAEKLQEWIEVSGDPMLVQRLGLTEQMDEALASSSDVAIDGKVWHEHILTNEANDALSPHIRVGIDSLTEFEALDLEESGINADIDAIDLRVLNESAVEVTLQAEAGPVTHVFHGHDHIEALFKAEKALTRKVLDQALNAKQVVRGYLDQAGEFVHEKEATALFGIRSTEDLNALKEAEAAGLTADEAFIMGQEAIDEATASLGLQAFFQNGREAGWTEKEFEAHLLKIANAKDTAARKYKKEALAQVQREQTTAWKAERDNIKEQVREELSQTQHYQAFNGIGKDRLNKAQVQEAVEQLDAQLGDLPKQSRGRRVYSGKNEPTIDLDAHAALYGYETGLEMIEDFLTFQPFNEAVDQRATEIMYEKHGTLSDRVQSVVEARKLLHESDYTSVIVDQINAMRRLRKARKLKTSTVRNAAKEQIKLYKVKNLKPARFDAAQKRLGRQAGIALRKGDFQKAEELKMAQLVNHQMSLLVSDAAKIAENRVKWMRNLIKFKKKGEKLPVEFQEAILEVLDAVNIRKSLTPKGRKRLQEQAARKDAKADIKQELLDADKKLNYRDMTLDELITVWETVKDLEHKGRTENKMMREHETQKRDINAAFVAEAIRKNVKPIQDTKDRTRWENLKRFGNQAATLAYNADTLLAQLDGHQDLGVVYSNIKGRHDRAMSEGYRNDQEGLLKRRKKVAQDVNQLFSVFTQKEKRNFNKKQVVPGIRDKLSHHEQIALLLQLGNDGNKRAVLDAGQLTEAEIGALLQHVSKRDLDFMQAVFDYKQTFWPEIKAAEQRRRNYTPREVKATPIETPHGTYQGGYYALRYDSQDGLVPRTEDLETLHNQARFGTYISQHTQRDHTETRKGNPAQKVSLDIFTIQSHLDQVVYDLEMGDAITDIYKILTHPEVKQAFSDVGQPHKFEWLELWTRDITTDQVFRNNVVERSLRWLRTGYTISKLGWNVGVGLLQPLGMLQASVHLGHQNMLWAMKAVVFGKWTGEGSIFNFVQSQTGFMATRAESYNKDIAEAQRQLKFTLLDTVTPSNSGQFIRDSFFWMIKTSQSFTDTVTWLAAHKKGMAQFDGDHLQAQRFADRAVARSQASGIFGERTNIERGSIDKRTGQTEMIRAFSVFISYFMAKTNVAMTRTQKTDFKSPAEALRWARDMFMLYTVEGLMAALITNRLDDDEPFVESAVNETTNILVAGIPFIRELGGEVQGFRGGGVPASISRDFGRVWTQVSEGEIDKELGLAANNVAGVLLHYPSAQINKSMRAYIDYKNNEDIRAVNFLLGPDFKKR